MGNQSILTIQIPPMLKSFCLLFCSLLFLYPSDSIAQSWDLAKDKNGIKVYTRKMAGNTLKDFKGKVTIKASAEKVAAVIKDIDNYEDWMPGCSDSRILKQDGNTVYQYFVQDAPWPVSDRDCVTKCTITESGDGSYRFDIVEANSFSGAPSKGSNVRIPSINSYWKVTPNGDGSSSVEYFANSDPGGSLPDWLVNSAVVDQPFDTLSSLKKKLER